MGVQFAFPDNLHSKHTTDSAALVYLHNLTTFVRLLHARIVFKKWPKYSEYWIIIFSLCNVTCRVTVSPAGNVTIHSHSVPFTMFFRLLYNRLGESNTLVKKIGPQDFNLPQNVIDIIYSQTLCWYFAFLQLKNMLYRIF